MEHFVRFRYLEEKTSVAHVPEEIYSLKDTDEAMFFLEVAAIARRDHKATAHGTDIVEMTLTDGTILEKEWGFEDCKSSMEWGK